MPRIEVMVGVPSRVRFGKNQFLEVANVVRKGIRASVADEKRRTAKEIMPLKAIKLGSTGIWTDERIIVGTTQIVEIPVIEGFDLTSVSNTLAVLAPTWLSSLGSEKGTPYDQLTVISFAFVE